MPFERPTLDELKSRVKADIESRVTGSPILPKSLLFVVAYAVAGLAHGIYGFIAWTVDQVLPTKAERRYLARWAAYKDVPDVDAAAATGTATGAGQSSTIPVGTAYSVNNLQFAVRSVDATEQPDGSYIYQVVIEALEVGASYNLPNGTVLNVVNTQIAGIPVSLTVRGDITTGSDGETLEAYRERVLSVLREPPQGGNATDYERWAREASSNVTRAFCYPLRYGRGTVGVAILDDNNSPPVASDAVIQEVQDYIDRPDVRPVTADVTVYTPEIQELTIDIELTPVSARSAVEESIRYVLSQLGEPGPSTIYISDINAAIEAVPSVRYYKVADSDHFEIEQDNVPVLGQINWV